MVDNSYLDILGVYRPVQELQQGDLIQLANGERYRIVSLSAGGETIDGVKYRNAHFPGGLWQRLYGDVLFLG